ncbi:MAG: hypothetical protein KF901_00475 [Myxococcales bacterium]|nr:hypothetical protein [Myxococcales bacterium]
MQKRALLVLVLSAFGLSACKSDDPPAAPTPSDESIIEVFREPVLTPEAVIPSRDSRLVGVEVFPSRLVFTYDSPGASVPGEGAVVAGVEEGGYLRRVLSVTEQSPTRFELTTEHAYLVDLFEDVHFRARFEPARGSWVETGRVGARTDALGGSFNLIDDLPISEHCGIAPGSNLEVKVDLSPTFDAEIDIFRRRGRTMRVELGGDVKVSVEVVGGAGIGVNCEFEIPAERLPSREFSNWFLVGWVPVVITHTIQAEVKLEVGASVSAGQVTANAEGGFGFRTGVSYMQDAGWSPIGTASRFGSASLDLTEPGTATVTAKFQPGISYLLKFYDTAGPQIALRPWVEGELTATYCTWEGTVTGGLTAALAPKVEVPVFDISLVEVNFDLDLFSGEIWSGDGTFPWCNDGGVEDSGVTNGNDAGVPGDGGTPTDGEVADPCSTHSTCAECNRVEGCGFCRASGACMSDTRRAECGTGWLDSPSSCTDCSGLTSCDSCVRNGFCGWCPGQGCLNQSTDEARMCSGFQPASCG